jgi:putative glutamine amidotransferase
MIKPKIRPLIGIVPDYVEGYNGAYSTRNFYALRENYVTMVNQAGGAAIILTYDYDLIDSYLEFLDGVVIVGGYFDINPNRYGETEIHKSVKLNKIREDFEFTFGDKILKTDIPFLGICNGMQLLNTLHGGKAFQHIPDIDGKMNHEQSHTEGFNDYKTPYHDIDISKDSKLFEIINENRIKTNSTHHQAVKIVGNGLQANAKADDGIIEGIEKPDHDFCLGVQWHPEFDTSKADKKIFEAFIKAAINYKSINRLS